MRVRNICNLAVTTALSSCSVRRAAALMREHHVGDVVIVEDSGGVQWPLGLVTDRDLVMETISTYGDPDTLTLGEIMSKPVYCLMEDEGVDHGLMRMRAAGVRRAPVIGTEGQLTGIVSVDDVIALLAERMGNLSALLDHERTRERDLRGSMAELFTTVSEGST